MDKFPMILFIILLILGAIFIVLIVEDNGEGEDFCSERGYEHQFVVGSYGFCYKIEEDYLIEREIVRCEDNLCWRNP